MRYLLGGLSAFYSLYAVYMWFAPQHWYDTTPGVAMMGPFNLHFIRDVAIAFLVSGAALGWGVWKTDRSAAVIGAAWPCLHGLFHIWIWTQRGFPLDDIAMTNWFGIQLPAWLALWTAFKVTENSATRIHTSQP